MIKIKTYLGPETVVRLDTLDHDEIVGQLVGICLGDTPSSQQTAIRKRALNAMAMRDQGLGAGFAITHARIDQADRIYVAAGLLPRPIRFAEWSDVHTVFCAIIPSDKAAAYLGFMAHLCRMLTQPEPRAAFVAGDRERVLECIQTFDA